MNSCQARNLGQGANPASAFSSVFLAKQFNPMLAYYGGSAQDHQPCALMAYDAAHGDDMRFSGLTIAVATAAFLAAGASFAADIEIPARPAHEDFSIQKGPPNCTRWTDECVNCSRGGEGERSVCSNIGFACQPQAIRCLSPAVPHSEPAKK